MADSKPADYYIGLLDFFAVVVPGACMGYLLVLGFRGTALEQRLAEPLSEPAAQWVAFAVLAYALGHLLHLLGGFFLDFALYDRWYSRLRTPYEYASWGASGLKALDKKIVKRKAEIAIAYAGLRAVGSHPHGPTLAVLEAKVRELTILADNLKASGESCKTLHDQTSQLKEVANVLEDEVKRLTSNGQGSEPITRWREAVATQTTTIQTACSDLKGLVASASIPNVSRKLDKLKRAITECERLIVIDTELQALCEQRGTVETALARFQSDERPAYRPWGSGRRSFWRRVWDVVRAPIHCGFRWLRVSLSWRCWPERYFPGFYVDPEHLTSPVQTKAKELRTDELSKHPVTKSDAATLSLGLFQWATLRAKKLDPAAGSELDRGGADSKFFRSLALVAVVAVVVFWPGERGSWWATGAALALIPLSLWRFLSRRWIAAQQTYLTYVALVAVPPEPKTATSAPTEKSG